MSFYDTDTRELHGLVRRGDRSGSPSSARTASNSRSPRRSRRTNQSSRSRRSDSSIPSHSRTSRLSSVASPSDGYPGNPRYSADGRFMVVSFGLQGVDAVVVWDLESPQQPVRTVYVPGAGRRGRPEPRRQPAVRQSQQPRDGERVRCRNRPISEQHQRAGRRVGGEPRWFAWSQRSLATTSSSSTRRHSPSAAGCAVTPSKSRRCASRTAAHCSPQAPTTVTSSFGT